MHKVRVTLKKGGKAQIRVEGVPGKACLAKTDDLEKTLGKKVKDIKTSEYYEEDGDIEVKAPTVKQGV